MECITNHRNSSFPFDFISNKRVPYNRNNFLTTRAIALAREITRAMGNWHGVFLMKRPDCTNDRTNVYVCLKCHFLFAIFPSTKLYGKSVGSFEECSVRNILLLLEFDY